MRHTDTVLTLHCPCSIGETGTLATELYAQTYAIALIVTMILLLR